MSSMCIVCSRRTSLLCVSCITLSDPETATLPPPAPTPFEGWSFSSHSSFCIPNTVISDRLLTSSQALPSDIKWQHPNTWGNKILIPVNSYLNLITPQVFICELVTWCSDLFTWRSVLLHSKLYNQDCTIHVGDYAFITSWVKCLSQLTCLEYQVDFFLNVECFMNFHVILLPLSC